MEKTVLRIKELREKKNLTQTELSEKAGVSRSLINQFETGKRTFANSKTLGKLAEVLECKISDFFAD